MIYNKPLQKFKAGSLFPILSAEKLLAGPSHQQLLRKLQALIGVSENHYDVLYSALIHHFAEFVQVLPLGESGRVASLLNEGLEHAFVSMQLLADLGITKSDQLLTYAVFSAALLQDVGKVIVNRRVMISDQTGAFIHEWSPHGQSMPQSVGSHFKIRYTQDAPLRMSSRVAPIFARQLLPEMGYTWITSNPQILTMWLAALGDTTDDDSGTVGIHLDLALRKLKDEKTVYLSEISVEISEPKETQVGEAFWQWLQQGLLEGHIAVDTLDAGIESLPGGLLLHEKIFRDFHKEGFMKGGNVVVAYTEFNLLGLVRLSGEDKIIQKYFSRPAHESISPLDKAAHFSPNHDGQVSYLAKQFHSLTGGPRLTPEPTPSSGVQVVLEPVIVDAKFLPVLPCLTLLPPEPDTVDAFFKREMEFQLRNQPPLFQPEKKY